VEAPGRVQPVEEEDEGEEFPPFRRPPAGAVVVPAEELPASPQDGKEGEAEEELQTAAKEGEERHGRPTAPSAAEEDAGAEQAVAEAVEVEEEVAEEEPAVEEDLSQELAEEEPATEEEVQPTDSSPQQGVEPPEVEEVPSPPAEPTQAAGAAAGPEEVADGSDPAALEPHAAEEAVEGASTERVEEQQDGSSQAEGAPEPLLEGAEPLLEEDEGPEPLLDELGKPQSAAANGSTGSSQALAALEAEILDVEKLLGEKQPEVSLEPGQEQVAGGIPGLIPPTHSDARTRSLPEVILQLEFASPEQVAKAEEESRLRGINAELILLETGAISEDQLARARAERSGLDYIDLTTFQVDPAATSLITNQFAKRYQAVPVALLDGGRTVLVAMANPSNVVAIDDLKIMTGKEVRVAVASPQDITDLIARMDRLEPVIGEGPDLEEEAGEALEVRETAEDAPIVKLVNQIIAQAVELGASDLHFAPTAKDLRVRFRIDGVLRDITTVPKRVAAAVVSRVKIMASLDISEKRMPQDGRVGLNIDGRHVDLRVVTLPSAKGEAVVMRILDKDSVVMDLDRLGMAPRDRERFERAFHLSHGAVLVTGPTGSGKTTTLYAALTKLNTKERNIITIEDPVEYQLEGVTQIQVQPKVGLTFAVGLRTMVRADPDVIMVGEIRDRETAQIAVESALTGHLVLSTLHTNDAPSAIHRLIEMGIEPFLVASAVECVLAQRLARTLCSHCKRRTVISAEALRANGFDAKRDIEAYEPVGCARCGGTGYRGRIAIYEVMLMSKELRELALARRSADELREVAVSQGMRRMRDDGLEKVRRGITALPEILRVIGSTT